MKYQFIEENKQEFPVVGMCRVLGVSESGFSAWRKRPVCQRQARRCSYYATDSSLAYDRHQGRYGCPRLSHELHDEGIRCSRKRIARLMRQAKLSACRKRHRVLTTKRDKTHPVAPNLLKREFQATEPNTRMGNRYYVYPNKARVALFGSDFRSLFKDGCRMVDVRQW